MRLVNGAATPRPPQHGPVTASRCYAAHGFPILDPGDAAQEALMDEDRFNMSVRKFLKVVGVTSQREIEGAIREAVKGGRLRGGERLRAKVTLTVEAVGLRHEIEDDIELG